MVVNTYHFNAANDLINVEPANILSDTKQKELLQVINQLKEYNPSKIIIEAPASRFTQIYSNFSSYIQGEYDLQKNESEQLGFRLAEACGHKQVYPVDWNEDVGVPDFFAWGQQNTPEKIEELTSLSNQLFPTEFSSYNIKDALKYLDGIFDQKNAEVYMKIAQIGNSKEPVGINWLVKYWHYRNLIICRNIIQLIDQKHDRLLVLYGAGHGYLLKKLLEESGEVYMERVTKYLSSD